MKRIISIVLIMSMICSLCSLSSSVFAAPVELKTHDVTGYKVSGNKMDLNSTTVVDISDCDFNQSGTYGYWYYVGSVNMDNADALYIDGFLANTDRNWLKIAVTDVSPEEYTDQDVFESIRITRGKATESGDMRYRIALTADDTKVLVGADESSLTEYSEDRTDYTLETSNGAEVKLLPNNLGELGSGVKHIYVRARYKAGINVSAQLKRSISGRITCDDAEQPSQFMLNSRDGHGSYTVDVDENGEFTVDEIFDGSYDVVFYGYEIKDGGSSVITINEENSVFDFSLAKVEVSVDKNNIELYLNSDPEKAYTDVKIIYPDSGFEDIALRSESDIVSVTDINEEGVFTVTALNRGECTIELERNGQVTPINIKVLDMAPHTVSCTVFGVTDGYFVNLTSKATGAVYTSSQIVNGKCDFTDSGIIDGEYTLSIYNHTILSDPTVIVDGGNANVTIEAQINTIRYNGMEFTVKQLGSSVNPQNTAVEIDEAESSVSLKTDKGNSFWDQNGDIGGFFFMRSSAENISMTIRFDEYNLGGDRKGGIMIRQNDNSRSKAAMIFLSNQLPITNKPAGLGLFSKTTAASAPSMIMSVEGLTAETARYIKLEKIGSKIYGYYSQDGVNFTKLDQEANLELTGEYLIGPAVCTSSAANTGFVFSEMRINDVDLKLPGEVSELKAKPVNGGAEITWSDPAETEIKKFDKVIVTAYDNEGNKVSETTVPKGTEKAELTGLTNNSKYTVKVQTAYENEIASKYHNYTPVSGGAQTEVCPIDTANSGSIVPVINAEKISIKTGEVGVSKLAFDKMYPAKSFEIKIQVPSGVTLDAGSVQLDESLVQAGAVCTKESDTIVIRYNGGSETVFLNELASVKLSGNTGTYTMPISGNVELDDGITVSLGSSSIAVSITAQSKPSSSSSSGGSGGYNMGSANKDKDDDKETVSTPAPTAAIDEGDKVDPSKELIDYNEISDWARESVDKLFVDGIISGVSTTGGYVFNPQGQVTRAEFVKLLVSAFYGVDASAYCDYSDVGVGDWYYPYLASAKKLGIASGLDDGRFLPNDPITRQDMAVMLYRTGSLKGLLTASGELDVTDKDTISDYAVEAVASLMNVSVMNGFEDNSFRPFEFTTREQAAKVIYGLINVDPKMAQLDYNSGVNSASAADEDSDAKMYRDEYYLFQNLNIASGGIDLTDKVTRREALKYVLKTAYGVKSDLAAADTSFTDIENDSISGYVDLALSKGVIKQGTDTNFYPNNAITGDEFLNMLVAALGYSEMADLNGGYPSGYRTIAGGLKLTDGVSIDINEELTYNQMFVILKNAISAERMEESTDVNGGIVKSDTTLAEELWNVEILDKAYVSSINRTASTATVTYTENGTTRTEILTLPPLLKNEDIKGMEFEIWYNDDTMTALYLKLKPNYDIVYDYIVEVNGDADSEKEYMGGNISYLYLYGQDKLYKVSADKDFSIELNGNNVKSQPIKLVNTYARVVLYNGEMVSVSAYELTKGGIFKTYTSVDNKIEYISGKSMNASLTKLDEYSNIIVYLDGMQSSIDYIDYGMLFDYAIVDDDFYMFASTNKASGVLESYSSDDMRIGGELYAKSRDTKIYYSADGGASYDDELDNSMMGQNVELLLDALGRVRFVSCSLQKSNVFYGVITAIPNAEAMELDTISVFCDHNGTEGVKSFKLNLSNKSELKDEDIIGIKDRYNMVFKFKVNDNNEITAIENLEWVERNPDVVDAVTSNGGMNSYISPNLDVVKSAAMNDSTVFSGNQVGRDSNLSRLYLQTNVTVNGEKRRMGYYVGSTPFLFLYDRYGQQSYEFKYWSDVKSFTGSSFIVRVGFDKENESRIVPDIAVVLSDYQSINGGAMGYGIVNKIEEIPDDKYQLEIREVANGLRTYVCDKADIYGEWDIDGDYELPEKGDIIVYQKFGKYEVKQYNSDYEEISEDEAAQLEEEEEEVYTQITEIESDGMIKMLFKPDMIQDVGTSVNNNNLKIVKLDNIYDIVGSNFVGITDDGVQYDMNPLVVENSKYFYMLDYDDYINNEFELKTYDDVNTIKDSGFSDTLYILCDSAGRYPKIIIRQ